MPCSASQLDGVHPRGGLPLPSGGYPRVVEVGWLLAGTPPSVAWRDGPLSRALVLMTAPSNAGGGGGGARGSPSKRRGYMAPAHYLNRGLPT